MILTANLEPPHGGQGFELGLLLHQERAAALAAHLESWIETATWTLELSPLLGSIEGGVRLLTNGKFDDIEVLPSETMAMSDIIVASTEQAGQTTVAPPHVSWMDHPSHEIHYLCHVRAPRLSPNAREHLRQARKGEPARPHVPLVYREPGGRLVIAVRTPSELPQAVQALKQSGAKTIVVQETT